MQSHVSEVEAARLFSLYSKFNANLSYKQVWPHVHIVHSRVCVCTRVTKYLNVTSLQSSLFRMSICNAC